MRPITTNEERVHCSKLASEVKELLAGSEPVTDLECESLIQSWGLVAIAILSETGDGLVTDAVNLGQEGSHGKD